MRLDDVHEHLVALAERQRAFFDLLARPLKVIAKWSSASPSEPSKWNELPVCASSACSTREPCPVNWAVTRGLICTRNASASGCSTATSRSLRSNSIAIVSSERITPSPSQVGQDGS